MKKKNFEAFGAFNRKIFQFRLMEKGSANNRALLRVKSMQKLKLSKMIKQNEEREKNEIKLHFADPSKV